jgi:predicted PurR-regulated permease PerM
MPLALAVLLAFTLLPLVALLERAGLHRLASVALVILVVLGGVACFGYALSRQFNDLAAHMPQYSVSIKSKLAALRGTRRGAITQIQETVKKAGHELDKQEMARHPPAIDAPVPVRKDVQPVLVVPNPPSDVEVLRATWEPFAKPLGTAGIALILTIFILVQHEDLRSRLIHLAGPGRVVVATRTLDEAAQRVSRFLFSQSVINATFGLVVTVGLLLIGIPYALLWGVTAAFLRFVPYLGTTIAMLLPATLAFVESEGWARTLETLVLFWAAGLVAYTLDPIVNGTRTGTSSFALLVAAIFWTWLWGPVGLLLSTPITVCLVAVGKHVPELEFLTVLLADEPSRESSSVQNRVSVALVNAFSRHRGGFSQC